MLRLRLMLHVPTFSAAGDLCKRMEIKEQLSFCTAVYICLILVLNIKENVVCSLHTWTSKAKIYALRMLSCHFKLCFFLNVAREKTFTGAKDDGAEKTENKICCLNQFIFTFWVLGQF